MIGVAVEHALTAVQVAQLLRGLERAVLSDGLRPRDRRRAGDVPAALRALLLVALRRDDLAGELRGGAHVDEVRGVADRGQHLLAPGADRVVAGLRGEARGAWLGTSAVVVRPSAIHFSRGPLSSRTLSWP